ncbi:hypothetical protein RGAI101_1265 [Roseobacter sp. GAI101]|nr:hypothetical protein RGAI101_1265 [Roseobacter sp. GAI101]
MLRGVASRRVALRAWGAFKMDAGTELANLPRCRWHAAFPLKGGARSGVSQHKERSKPLVL